MKKKTVAAMLVMCMALSAAACGTEKKDSTEETTESGGTTEASEKADGRLVTVDDVSDYVTIGEYKGLKLERITNEVTDDDVQAEIEYEMSQNTTEVSDGTVESGDTVRINYTGTVDGEELENGSEEDYDLVIGDAVLGEEFDNALIGMASGDTKKVEVSYPEDYYDTDVAGKTVEYTVTLQTISRPGELSDEWVAANTDYQTVDEYQKAVRTSLEENESLSADLTLYYNAWNTVLESSEVKEYPEADLAIAEKEYKALQEGFLEEAGMSQEEFLEAQSMTDEEYEEACTEYAQAKVEQNLIVQGIMDAEGLSLEDEEMDELKELLLQEYGYESMDDLIDEYGEDEVNESLTLLRVERFIVDNGEVSEMSGDENDPIANEATEDEEISDEAASEEETAEASEDAAGDADVESMDAETTDDVDVADETAEDGASDADVIVEDSAE